MERKNHLVEEKNHLIEVIRDWLESEKSLFEKKYEIIIAVVGA
jgi:hypothetical protein